MANGREPLGNGVIWLLGQMVRLPVEAFVYSMEMMVKTLQGLQRMADRSVDALMGSDAPSPPDEPARESNLSNSSRTVAATAHATGNAPDSASDHPHDTVNLTHGATITGGEKTEKEHRDMPDTNLSDDMLKLVRYKVLFVKRDYEHAFKEDEDLVWDNMTGDAYTAWKIAEFIQRLKDGNADKVRVPERWREKRYADDHWGTSNETAKTKLDEAKKIAKEADSAADKNERATLHKRVAELRKEADEVATYYLTGFPPDDKKYLRVFYEVLQRYPREKLRYEERHLEVLEQIRDKMDP
jgi:hypothetical protein